VSRKGAKLLRVIVDGEIRIRVRDGAVEREVFDGPLVGAINLDPRILAQLASALTGASSTRRLPKRRSSA
jgi:hypothetical protein